MIAAKLHNFVINQGLQAESIDPHPHAVRAGRADLGFSPTNPSRAKETLMLDPENDEDEHPEAGSSLRRENFLYFIEANGLSRPDYNVERNG